MIKNFKPPFSRFVKKSHKPLQLAIEDAVDEVCVDVTIGEAKVGDLAGIRVYKFKFNRQEYLMAYRPPAAGEVVDLSTIEWLTIDFYQVGLHENFYDDLKRYLKTEG
ncbi:MAG: type II toxin-antitoxin system RelE/ParE family toxin [Burkholderiales bacterium]|nr:type II toxin-antitoxin system RelE/ParE family toxin [Burkholderiales bacterium]